RALSGPPSPPAPMRSTCPRGPGAVNLPPRAWCWSLLPGASPSLLVNESLGHLVRQVIGMLHRGRLHEVGARPLQSPAHAAIYGELDHAHRVNDDAGGV